MYIPPWDLNPVSAYILNSASEPTELPTDEPLCRAKQGSFCSKGTKEVGKKNQSEVLNQSATGRKPLPQTRSVPLIN